jgi:hypothetical protein
MSFVWRKVDSTELSLVADPSNASVAIIGEQTIAVADESKETTVVVYCP